MRKVLLFLLTVLMVLSMTPCVSAEAYEIECTAHSGNDTRSIIPIDFQCPYCGAVGYPTGQTTIVPLGSNIVSPNFLPIYMIYECSADSSHRWTVYLAETTT